MNLVLTNPKDHVLSFKPVALNGGCTLEISWGALKSPDTQAPPQPIKVESLEVGSRQGQVVKAPQVNLIYSSKTTALYHAVSKVY